MKKFQPLTAVIALALVACLAYFGLRPDSPESETRQGHADGDATGRALDLSDDEVLEIIKTQRQTRDDLPTGFDEATWSIRRERNHYVVVENAVPEQPHHRNLFKLNRRGVIVDVIARDRFNTPVNCPERVFTESELAEIVRKERATRDDVPPLFEKYRVRVSRLRCLYLYFEYRQPERRGDYQVFTIDPEGEVMEFSRSEPY